MGKYDARIEEMRQQLTNARGAESSRETDRLSELIGLWAPKREALLDELTSRAHWAVAIADPLPAKWTRLIAAARVELGTLFGESAKDLKLKPGLQLWWFAAFKAEDDFLSTLAALPLPGRIVDLNKHQAELGQRIVELQEKWLLVLDQKRLFRTPETQVIDELDRMVQDAVKDLESKYKEALLALARLPEQSQRLVAKIIEKLKLTKVEGVAEEAAKEAAKKIVEEITQLEVPEGSGEAAKTTAQALSTTAAVAKTVLDAYFARVRTYKDLLSRERGSVLRMFMTNREAVGVYMRESGMVKAVEWRIHALTTLEQWVNARRIPGQKTDATVFATEVGTSLKTIWDQTETFDRQFRERFSGVFMGTLTNETLESLAEKYLFERHLEKVHARGASGRIDDYSRMLPPAIGSEIDKGFDPLLKVRGQVSPEIEQLLSLKCQQFKAYVQRYIQSQVEELVRTSYSLRDIFRKERISVDFDRGELSSDLR